MEEQYDEQLDPLIETMIDVGNHLSGQQQPVDGQNLWYAEGLGKKIIRHVLTARYLYGGYQLTIGANQYHAEIDFASIALIVRGAWETYLAMNYVFVSGKDDEEKKFRFDCWHLSGFLERTNAVTHNLEFIDRKNRETVEIGKLQQSIQLSPLFVALTKEQKNAVLKGDWRRKQGWAVLAEQAGYDEAFFKQQYKHLCSYAHSGRLSVLQMNQVHSLPVQKEMAKASVGLLLLITSKFLYDYAVVIPGLFEILKAHKNYDLVVNWKHTAETIELESGFTDV